MRRLVEGPEDRPRRAEPDTGDRPRGHEGAPRHPGSDVEGPGHRGLDRRHVGDHHCPAAVEVGHQVGEASRTRAVRRREGLTARRGEAGVGPPGRPGLGGHLVQRGAVPLAVVELDPTPPRSRWASPIGRRGLPGPLQGAADHQVRSG